MEVWIKTFDVRMQVKSNGMELEVRTPDGEEHLGDCYVTQTGITWCEGRTRRQNGVKISWNDLRWILGTSKAKAEALKAAKATYDDN